MNCRFSCSDPEWPWRDIHGHKNSIYWTILLRHGNLYYDFL